jgi:hydrogenase nickel incorporation protein HypA/HybF
MHELSICENLLAIALEEARRATPTATRITHITVGAGALRQIIPENLNTAFEALSANTLAEGAALEIHTIPAAGRCPACSWRGILESSSSLLCPACEACAISLESGKELLLERLEIE